MALFKVISIIDGDTIRVSPNWSLNGRNGDIVKIRGYRTPLEQDQPFVTKRVRNLLLNQSVELKNAIQFTADSEAILCDVVLNGVNVSKYFLSP